MSNLKNLFESSRDEGSLSADSLNILTLPDLGAKIQQGLGVAVDDVPASEVFLLTLLVDDSGSIRGAKNEALVIDGYNSILTALKESKQESGILIHTRYLNGIVLSPYTPIAQAQPLDASNYQATGSTPLYDESVTILGTVIAKTQEFADAGVPARSVTVIITDGADCGSYRHKARDVMAIVDDMLKSENHIVAGVGLSDGHTNFRKVFSNMGIEDRWILTPGTSKGDIRAAFRVISQTAVRTSQGRGQFSRAAAGGFGAP
ncbi:MAG TPA: hypothetical protein VII12_03100 [Thermoanaerobaculia bacterium]|jgi:hypothetical protein